VAEYPREIGFLDGNGGFSEKLCINDALNFGYQKKNSTYYLSNRIDDERSLSAASSVKISFDSAIHVAFPLFPIENKSVAPSRSTQISSR